MSEELKAYTSHLLGEMQMLKTMASEDFSRIARLRDAVANARSGLELAYEAVAARRYDEALLHCGHHEAAARKALREEDAAHRARIDRLRADLGMPLVQEHP